VKVNAEKKGGFLFWGNNLDIKQYKTVKELPPLKESEEVINPNDKFRSLRPISIEIRF